MDVVEVIAQNLAESRFEDLPSETVDITKRSILDTLGVMLAASTLGDGCREMVEIASAGGGREESTVIGFGGKLPSWIAAFANGALTHALDYDDTADAAQLHPTASTLPAALALAESQGKSGKELTISVALGNDLVTRLGLALTKSKSHYDWLSPQVLGAFGSAAAAGKILGLGKEQMVSALGHVLNQTAGSSEVSLGIGSVFRGIRDAFTAKAGVLSALMAQRGLVGVQNVFQGKAGLFNLYFRGNYDPVPLTAELGKRFEGTYVSFKPWPSCRGTHPFIDATLSLVKENDIKPGDVERVTLTVGSLGKRLCIPEDKRRKPSLSIDAKFSLPFTVAVAIAKRSLSLGDFSHAAMQDTIVLYLATKVTWKYKQEFDAAGIGRGIVEIRCKGNRVFSKGVNFAYGHPHNPLSQDDLMVKFRDCAVYSVRPLSPRTVEETMQGIMHLETIANVGKITELLG